MYISPIDLWCISLLHLSLFNNPVKPSIYLCNVYWTHVCKLIKYKENKVILFAPKAFIVEECIGYVRKNKGSYLEFSKCLRMSPLEYIHIYHCFTAPKIKRVNQKKYKPPIQHYQDSHSHWPYKFGHFHYFFTFCSII